MTGTRPRVPCRPGPSPEPASGPGADPASASGSGPVVGPPGRSRVLPDVDPLAIDRADQPVGALAERVAAAAHLRRDPWVIEEAAQQEDVAALRDPVGL